MVLDCVLNLEAPHVELVTTQESEESIAVFISSRCCTVGSTEGSYCLLKRQGGNCYDTFVSRKEIKHPRIQIFILQTKTVYWLIKKIK